MKNLKKNNIKFYILLVAVLIICIIFIDLIFNFSSLLMNNYERFVTDEELARASKLMGSGASGASGNLNTSNIKSIISKTDGKIFNIYTLSENIDKNEILVQIPVSQTKNLSLNDDGSFSESPKSNNNQNQNWRLIKIDSPENYETILKDSDDTYNGTSVNNLNYPLTILISQNYIYNKWALNYDSGVLSNRPIGNYKSQHWDTSEIILPKNNFYTYDPSKTLHSKFGMLQQGMAEDPNKIKINLNLKDKNILSLLSGFNSSGDNMNGMGTSQATSCEETQTCDKYMHKSALSGLCPGCDLPESDLV